MQGLQSNVFIPFMAAIGLLSACAGESSPEKAFIGTWVQDTPYSTTDKGLQTTTSDTVLRLKKNGETHLSRKLDSVLVIPRSTDEKTREWADKLQTQAEQSSASEKTIISVDKKQLILQDIATGTTDVYRRK